LEFYPRSPAASPREYNTSGGPKSYPKCPGKKWGTPVRDPFREIVDDLILDWDLEDINPPKGLFTWSTKIIGSGHIAARLNRFLFQHSLLLLGLTLDSSIIPFNASDHKPILLSISQEHNLGPIPFHFSPSWIQHDEFLDVVSSVWKEAITSPPFLFWEEKLRNLKATLKSWAKSLKTPLFQRMAAQQALEQHQIQVELLLVDPNCKIPDI
jgi:hypothetical protein